jgi:hypothetical protein
MSDEVRAEVVQVVAADPRRGDHIVGAGGIRKLRHARPGKGKSGGFRVMSYFHSADYPVFLLTVFGKNQTANLGKAERNALGVIVEALIDRYPAKRDRAR